MALVVPRQQERQITIASGLDALAGLWLLQGDREKAETEADTALKGLATTPNDWLTTVAMNWLLIASGAPEDVQFALSARHATTEVVEVLRRRYLLDIAAISAVCIVGNRLEPEYPARYVDALASLPRQATEWFGPTILRWLVTAARERGDGARADKLAGYLDSATH